MAITNYSFNAALPHGQLLRQALNGLNNAHVNLPAVRDLMQANIDGNGSDPAHFTMVTTRFGFGSNEYAKAAWEELNSCIFKLTTNSSVTDVDAAIRQLLTRLRA